MLEEYKIINEFENSKFAISNFGNIKNILTGKIKNIYDNGHGYKSVSVYGKLFYIHRLVAKYFLDNPENKKEVNHKDGVRSNNNLSNLEWCTTSENLIHKFRVLKVVNNCGMRGKRNELCKTSKPLIQLSLDGFILNVFPSNIEAQRFGFDRRNTYRAVKSQTKYKGYLWA